MSILETIYHGHLQQLLGPNATITDVEYLEGYEHVEATIEFKLPVDQLQDFVMPVKLNVSGIYDGKLECSITDSALEDNLRFLSAMQEAVRTYPRLPHSAS